MTSATVVFFEIVRIEDRCFLRERDHPRQPRIEIPEDLAKSGICLQDETVHFLECTVKIDGTRSWSVCSNETPSPVRNVYAMRHRGEGAPVYLTDGNVPFRTRCYRLVTPGMSAGCFDD